MLRTQRLENRNNAAFFCDHCKKRIDDIRLALFTWKELRTFRWEEDKEPEFVISRNHPSVLVEQGQIYTVHKACIDQFEKEQGRESYHWPELELIDLLVFVIHNGGLNIADIQKRAAMRGEMGL